MSSHDGAEGAHSRVVHEDVEMPLGSDRGVDEALHRAGLADIRNDRLGAAAGSGDAIRALLHGGLGPSAKDHVGACRAKALGDGPPDAARRSRHDGCAALEFR
jgi:hypothetical protein